MEEPGLSDAEKRDRNGTSSGFSNLAENTFGRINSKLFKRVVRL